jgi:ribA/ribD-fused uncharacterized protein
MSDCDCIRGVRATTEGLSRGAVQIHRCPECRLFRTDVEAAFAVARPNRVWWVEDIDMEVAEEVGQLPLTGWASSLDTMPVLGYTEGSGPILANVHVGVSRRCWEKWLHPEPEIREFKGPYFYLSNFYHSPMMYLGYHCPTAEHAFQLAKAADTVDMRRIAEVHEPAEAKLLGRQVVLRDDWEQVKLSVMKDVVTLKFAGNPVIRQRLVSTGSIDLVEGNYWGDTYWGRDNKTGAGANHLGRILMEVRSLFQER